MIFKIRRFHFKWMSFIYIMLIVTCVLIVHNHQILFHSSAKSPVDLVTPNTSSDQVVSKKSPNQIVPKTSSDQFVPKTSSDQVVPKTASNQVVPKTVSNQVVPKTLSDLVAVPKTSSNMTFLTSLQWNHGKQLCYKRKDIAFLKVHKCGSTTMSNIIQRFAIRNNLNLVLPNKTKGEHQYWVLGKLDQSVFKRIIPIPKGKHYNIISVDTVYNRDIYKQLLPNNPFFLAIFREPFERHVSNSFYNNSTMEVLQKLAKISPYVFKFKSFKASGILRDFAFSGRRGATEFTIQINKDFDMIMITEYFDESLVLLKRKLCWNTEDIIYMSRNIKSLKRSYALSPEDINRMNKQLPADKIFYDFFQNKLFNEIIKSGAEFLEEVYHFKLILKMASDYCIYLDKSERDLVIPKSKWNNDFTINPTDCYLMQLQEFSMIQHQQKRQWELFTENNLKSDIHRSKDPS